MTTARTIRIVCQRLLKTLKTAASISRGCQVIYSSLKPTGSVALKPLVSFCKGSPNAVALNWSTIETEITIAGLPFQNAGLDGGSS